MKKIIKILIMAAVLLTIMIAGASIASATAIQATQIDCEDNSVTISIPPTGNAIDHYAIRDNSSNTYIATNIPGYSTSYTLEGLKKGYVSYIRIEGYEQGKSYYTDYASLYINTTPTTLEKSKFSISSAGSDYVYLQAARPSYDFNVQYEIRKVSNGSKVVGYSGSSISDKLSVKKNVAYKYRTRLYYTNTTTKETYYGAWSSYRYFINPSATAKKNYSTGRTTLKVKGVSNVSKYKVYVSNDRSTSGGKLLKTLTPSKGKTASYTFKTSKSYIKVVPVISGNHKSDIYHIIYN